MVVSIIVKNFSCEKGFILRMDIYLDECLYLRVKWRSEV